MTNQFPLGFADLPPFWYGSFSGLWVYYKVPLKLAQAYLDQFTKTSKGPGFTAFAFENDTALVNLNFMSYGAHTGQNDPRAYYDIQKPMNPATDPMPFGFGVEPATETELSIIAYPTARVAQIPDSTFAAADFVAGNDHTKTLGAFRLYVPCDDRIAVYWGSLHFGENKFMTYPYPYIAPSPNGFPSPNNPNCTLWDFTIPGGFGEPGYAYDPNNNTCTPFILRLQIDVSNLVPAASNPSEILDYSMWKDTDGTVRPIGSRRNIFGNFSSYVFSQSNSPQVSSLQIGNSTHPMVQDFAKLVGNGTQPYAAQVFQTQPVIAESGTYYVDV